MNKKKVFIENIEITEKIMVRILISILKEEEKRLVKLEKDTQFIRDIFKEFRSKRSEKN